MGLITLDGYPDFAGEALFAAAIQRLVSELFGSDQLPSHRRWITNLPGTPWSSDISAFFDLECLSPKPTWSGQVAGLQCTLIYQRPLLGHST